MVVKGVVAVEHATSCDMQKARYVVVTSQSTQAEPGFRTDSRALRTYSRVAHPGHLVVDGRQEPLEDLFIKGFVTEMHRGAYGHISQ